MSRNIILGSLELKCQEVKGKTSRLTAGQNGTLHPGGWKKAVTDNRCLENLGYKPPD
jgi:hypothetical protein